MLKKVRKHIIELEKKFLIDQHLADAEDSTEEPEGYDFFSSDPT